MSCASRTAPRAQFQPRAGRTQPYCYRIENEWRVEASVEEVAAIFRDTRSLATWWPAVFREARVLRAGGTHEVGKQAEVTVRGWMPHAMRFAFEVVRADPAWGFEVRATRDFEGRGTCRYRVEGSSVVLQFVWEVEVRRPLVRHLSWLLRPVFVSNHAWAMAAGAESLATEVARRRAGSAMAKARIPAPPAPTFSGRGGLRRLLDAPRRWVERLAGNVEGVTFARRMAG